MDTFSYIKVTITFECINITLYLKGGKYEAILKNNNELAPWAEYWINIRNVPVINTGNTYFSMLKIGKILSNFFMAVFYNLKLVSTTMKNAKYFPNWVPLKIWKLSQQEPVCPRLAEWGIVLMSFKAYNSLFHFSGHVEDFQSYRDSCGFPNHEP